MPQVRVAPELLGTRFQRSLNPPTSAPQYKTGAPVALPAAQPEAIADTRAVPLPMPPEMPAPLVAIKSLTRRTGANASAGDTLARWPRSQSTASVKHPQITVAGREWEQSLVRLAHKLCGSSDVSMTHWTIQIPLDPDVLPETTLHLALSPHRLQLRFNTQSSWSLHLISERTSMLLQLLHESLPDLRDIDIELT
jgi:Type III secretion protein (HpaP)